jgi:tRNA pseudouridine55 synthase
MLNGILIVDKPAGLSSHGVVVKLRRLLGERRIGHGGTLDPIATGLLPVLVGRATRATDFLTATDKEYIAHFRLGITTDTQDITGKIISVSDRLPSVDELRGVLEEFTGTMMQLPPMYSAIKVGGKKLYELARSGITVERQPREIKIHLIELLADELRQEPGSHAIRVGCSKGTYIRTLIHDIGTRLGCGAAMTALRRTKTGPFDISMARTPEEIEHAQNEGNVSSLLIPVDFLFDRYPGVRLDEHGERLCRNGTPVPVHSAVPGALYRVYGPGGVFLMLGRATVLDGKTVLRTVRNFFNAG